MSSVVVVVKFFLYRIILICLSISLPFFNYRFIWQMCAYIPTTLSLSKDQSEISIPLLAVKLGASFVLETLIHAKEKVFVVN